MAARKGELRPLGFGAQIVVRLIEIPITEIASLPLTGFLLLGEVLQMETVVEIAQDARQRMSDVISGRTDDLLSHFGRSLGK
jgi:hypothetical protein